MRARHDRRRGQRERRDQGHAARAGHAHQRGERQLRPRRPGFRRPHRERRDHGAAGRRPLADEVRRSRPGACGRGAHLHAHDRQLGTARRHQRAAHRHPARRRRRSSPRRRHRAAARRRPAPSPARSARSRTRAARRVEIKVTPQEGGTITNEATVSSDEGDPTAANNSASAETTVSPAADLELTKTDSPDPVPAGGLLTYTLAVHNAGPSSAPAVQLTDTLPAGVTFESADALAGHLLRGGRHRRLRARHASPTRRPRPSRSRSGRRPPARSRTTRASCPWRSMPTRLTTARAPRRPSVDGRRPVADQDRLAGPVAARASS